MLIPKLSHKIWVGSFLSEEFQNNYIDLILNMPGYEHYLWTDFSSLTLDEKNQFITFAQKHNIRLNEISKHIDLTNFDHINYELTQIKNCRKNKALVGVHAVRLADLLRMSVLKRYGGVYTDTDSKSYKTLIELKSHLGIILNKNDQCLRLRDKLSQIYLPNLDGFVLYDFIASIPEHPIIVKTCEIMDVNYKTLRGDCVQVPLKDENKKYHYEKIYTENPKYQYLISCEEMCKKIENSRIKAFQNEITILLTGTALPDAVNDFVARHQISPATAQRLFFQDREKYLSSFFSNSWAHGTTEGPCTQEDVRKEVHIVSFTLLLQKNKEQLMLQTPSLDRLKLGYGLLVFSVLAYIALNAVENSGQVPAVCLSGYVFFTLFNLLDDTLDNLIHSEESLDDIMVYSNGPS